VARRRVRCAEAGVDEAKRLHSAEVRVRWAGPLPLLEVGIEAAEPFPRPGVGEIFRPPRSDGKPFARGIKTASVVVPSRTLGWFRSLHPGTDPATGLGGIKEMLRGEGGCVANRKAGSLRPFPVRIF